MPIAKKLTRFNRLFAERVAGGELATHAMRAMRPKLKRPDVAAAKMMAIPEVRELVEKLREDTLQAAGISRVRIAKELGRIAFADPRKLLADDGGVKSLSDIDDDTAAAIAGIDVEELFVGRGEDRTQIGHVRKVKLWNKREALSELASIAGMKRNEGPTTPNIGPGLTVIVQQAVIANGEQGTALQGRVVVDLPKPA